MAFKSTSSAWTAGCAMLAAVLLAALVPAAHAGAVFEIRKPLLTNASDYIINFNQPAAFPAGTPGSIIRTSTPFNATYIPYAIINLNRCSALAPHVHPLGSEQLYVIQGSIIVFLYFDNNSYLEVPVPTGQGVIIPQGAVHFLRTTTGAKLLQTFDHPQAGAVFVGQALLEVPRNVLNAYFQTTSFPTRVTPATIFSIGANGRC